MSVHALASRAAPAAVEVREVTRLAGARPILERINFRLGAGELVAVLGPSGAGKSTLVEVLVGATRPERGELHVHGHAPGGAAGPVRVGYVAQQDLAPALLTLREALVDAAALRAPALLAAPVELEARLCRLAARLGLGARLDTRLGQLSGGERRRASLALELLGEPGLLVVDEVTSGLDAAAERRAVEALRAVADGGPTVVAITHTLGTLHLFDRVLLLHGGRLVWDGPLPGALAHFRVAGPEALYARLAERAPAEWAALAPAPAPLRGTPRAAPVGAEPGCGPDALHQLGPRLRRQLRLMTREGWSLLLLLGQAPLIAALIAFAYDGAVAAGRAELGFKLALAAIWLGCVGSCQELVRERALYRHERLAGLSRAAYLASKLVCAALLAAVQGATLGAVALLLEPGLGCAALDLLPGLVAGALAGAALGLLVSALVRTRTAAVGLTPLLLVPQILFVGTLTPLSGAAAGLARLMPSWWAELAVRGALSGRGPGTREALVLGGFAAVLALLAAGVVAARDALERGER